MIIEKILSQNKKCLLLARYGNGVIATEGAVLAKNVSDYAIVAGVSARIIRYSNTKEQIGKMHNSLVGLTEKRIRYYLIYFGR